MDHVPVNVGEDLYFDVTGSFDQPLEEHAAVAEGRGRLALGGRERGGELARLANDPHALATATGGRRDEQPKPESLRRLSSLFGTRPKRDQSGEDRAARVSSP